MIIYPFILGYWPQVRSRSRSLAQPTGTVFSHSKSKHGTLGKSFCWHRGPLWFRSKDG